MDRGSGLADACIDIALKRNEVEAAFSLAEALAKHRLSDVHLHLAMALEDQGRFDKAEVTLEQNIEALLLSLCDHNPLCCVQAEFILAGKPKEAIEMHCHTGVRLRSCIPFNNDPSLMNVKCISQDFAAAMRVAESSLPSAIPDIVEAQAARAVASKDYPGK